MSETNAELIARWREKGWWIGDGYANTFIADPDWQEAADALERAERQLAEAAANEAELRRCLTCALGVVVEFGDLNGFRNTTDQELGKLVIVVAEESATTLNCPASAAAKRYEAMEAALQAAEEALTDMDMNHGGAGKALLMVRAALDRSTAPVCKES